MNSPTSGPIIGEELAWSPVRLVSPGPWTGHILFAFWLIKALRPARFVELGTHSGNSYFAFCQAIAAVCPGASAYAVDTWAGDEHAGRYGEEVFADVARFNAAHFAPFSTLLRATFDDARPYFPDGGPEGGVDLLHIDGLHSYEAVRHDFETWRTALSDHAVVLFHDINVRERDFGVWRLWEELRATYPGFAFHHSNGLGVLGVGPDQPDALRALYDLGPDEAAIFRRTIAARGEAFERGAELLALREVLAVKEAHIADLTGQIARVAGPEGLGGQAEAARAEVHRQAAWRESLVGAVREAAVAKDMAVANAGEMAAALAAALATRDRIIDARDALAMRLRDDLAAQREDYEIRLVHARNAQEGLTDAFHKYQLNAQATLAATHAQYLNSTSWQVTRPLRIGVRMLRSRRLRPGAEPQPSTLPTHPLPATPAPPAEDAPAPPAADAKAAMRATLSARLDAFLATSATLRLPRSASPDVSIVLVLYNQAELTFGCLASIIETLSDGEVAAEVVILDNASTDRTAALLDRVEGATIIRSPANLHFLKGVNEAARSATGRTILLLNNDAQLLPGAVASALRTLDSAPDIGAVGGRIILPDGTLQEAGSILWRNGAASGYARGTDPNGPDVMFQRDVDYCSGAFLLTPTAVWREMGGFDERYAPAYYEETDYCVRLWKSGRRVVFDPDVAILHYEFGSSSSSADALALQSTNHRLFTETHRDWLDGAFPLDPASALAARTARSDRPRILVIEDRVPKVELGTGYPRANRLQHELLAAGAEVTLFPAFHHPETWPGVRRALDKRIEVLIRAESSQLREYLRARRRHFDAFLVCRPHNMEAFEAAVGADRDLIGDARVIYDAEALFVSRTLQRRAAEGDPAPDPDRRALVASEVSLTRLAHTVLSVSEAERETLRTYGATDIRILGHALDDVPLPGGYEERDEIVFLGAVQEDTAPNAEAVLWFANDILPPLRRALGADTRLTVVGRVGAPAALP